MLAQCERLGEFLRKRGAIVWFVVLPAGEHGQKVGLDDYIAGGASWRDVQANAVEELPSFATVAEEEAKPEDTFDDVPDELGAELLEEIVTFVRRFVVLRNQEQRWCLALWAVHTWCVECFSITPRLSITTPK